MQTRSESLRTRYATMSTEGQGKHCRQLYSSQWLSYMQCGVMILSREAIIEATSEYVYKQAAIVSSSVVSLQLLCWGRGYAHTSLCYIVRTVGFATRSLIM